MEVKLFWKENCPKCPPAKELAEKLEKEGVNINRFNIGTTEGLAEATYFDVLATPTIVVVDEAGSEIASWRGEAPSESVIKGILEKNA